MDKVTKAQIAEAFVAHRAQLLAVIQRQLHPVLLKRLAYEDVLQSACEEAMKRLGYFEVSPEVPIYFKLRTVVLQVLADLERKHLQSQSRDAFREQELAEGVGSTEGVPGGGMNWGQIAAEVSSPGSHIARVERNGLLRQAIAALPEQDRQILVLRHFDEMGNQACAEILRIDPKAASIRYKRALERLQRRLMDLSCFRN